MTFIKLDDTFPDHEKVISLSDGAFRLHIAAMCYASRNLTNGKVSRATVKHLHGTMPRVKELFEAGLWEAPVDFSNFDGWVIHDYLKYQRSREEIETLSERRSRARREQVAKQRVNKVPTNSQPDSREQKTESRKQRAEAESREHVPRAVLDAFNDQSPGGINPVVVDELDSLFAEGITEEWLVQACREAGAQGGRKPIKYITSIIRRWQKDGFQKDGRNGSGTAAFVSGLGGRSYVAPDPDEAVGGVR